MPDTPTEATTAGGPLMLMEIARAKESRISPHQPTVPFSAHHGGNQTTDEARRDV